MSRDESEVRIPREQRTPSRKSFPEDLTPQHRGNPVQLGGTNTCSASGDSKSVSNLKTVFRKMEEKTLTLVI